MPQPAHSHPQSSLQSVRAVGRYLRRYPFAGVACLAPGTCKQHAPQITANLVVHGGATNLPTQPALVHAAAAMLSTPITVVSKRARGGGRSPGSQWQVAICKLMILSYLPDRSKAPRSNLQKAAQRTLARSLPVRQTSPHTHAVALSGLWPLPRLRAVKL